MACSLQSPLSLKTLRKTIHNGTEPERVASDIIQTIEHASTLQALLCGVALAVPLDLCKRLFSFSLSKVF